MKHLGRDLFELSTGRRFDANIGSIGMSPSLHRVTEGYDGHLYGVTPDDYVEDVAGTWTDAERAELADYMSDLWQRWKAKHTAGEPRS